jgi:uncharacterized membrane protein
MSLVAGGMMAAGIVALAAGLIFVRPRFRAAEGADKIILLGPVLEAVALAMFAAEHSLATRDLMLVVPRWIPGPMFWTCFVGVCLAAAAISFIAWRYVHWSATLLALMFAIIVATIDLPQLTKVAHQRFFWILTVRELAFASGALVLAGSEWRRRGSGAGTLLMRVGRVFIAAVFVFYAIEHFLFPRNVPGVPLQKLTPAWMPAPTLIACLVGAALLIAGPGLVVPRTFRIAAAGSGMVLLALTVFFYLPILVSEIHTPQAVEGMNYVGDTLLFASTALLAGFDGGLNFD